MKTSRKIKILRTASTALKIAPLATVTLALVVGKVEPLDFKDDSPWTSG